MRMTVRWLALLAVAVVSITIPADAANSVKGTFTIGRTDASLRYVRAVRVQLDAKKKGYAILLTARPAEGDTASWKTAEPSARGSFIYVLV